jgi:predicted nuclease with TOPRIM domain
MAAIEPARHALYSRLEEVLGTDHADTLMAHLPQDLNDQVATKGDLEQARHDLDRRFDLMEERFNRMEERFDRMEERFDRMEDRMDRNQRFYVGTTLGTLTAMTAIFSIIVSILG